MASSDLPDWQSAVRSISQPLQGPVSVPAQVGITPGGYTVAVTADASWRSITILCDASAADKLYASVVGSPTAAIFSPAQVAIAVGVYAQPMAPYGFITVPVSLAYDDQLWVQLYNTDSQPWDMYVIANMTDATVMVQGGVTPQNSQLAPLVVPVEITSALRGQGTYIETVPIGGLTPQPFTAAGASTYTAVLPSLAANLAYRLHSITHNAAGGSGTLWLRDSAHTENYWLGDANTVAFSLLGGMLITTDLVVFNSAANAVVCGLQYDTVALPTIL